MSKPFFDEPFDLAHIATVLLDDRFVASAYFLCGERKRWDACAAQLPELFLAFMREEIPDHRLYKLAALMFQWTFRFYWQDGQQCRMRLIESLDFIDQEKWQRIVASSQREVFDPVLRKTYWEFRHQWAPWHEKRSVI